MNSEEIIVTKLIELTIEKSISFFSNFLKNDNQHPKKDFNEIRAVAGIHIAKSINFSKHISLYKISDHLDLASNSIELKLANQDRRFYSRNQNKSISEVDLITDDRNHIILGDPGAGKTTTLKRLVSKFYGVLFSSESESIKYSFPIVVRLSEIKPEESLLIHLCHQLGIGFDTIRMETPFTENEEVYEEYYDENLKDYLHRKRQVKRDRVKITYEYRIGSSPLKFAISEYLNAMCCIIFIDGLDEINYLIKDQTFLEIKDLSNNLRDSKIILTSRYLPDISSFKQFNINEIKPLSGAQKREISALWIDNVDAFFAKMESLPYKDIADRPLFLSFLLRLFAANNHELPEQAVDVYRQIILLAIREWDYDKEQEIRRFSKYKSFNTYKKEDFLSELAFELTYSQQAKKTFTRTQLQNAYIGVYSRYSELTVDDRIDIVRDIESHNGLIIEAISENFEFSHLSLQEYLCAKYIISIPISRRYYEQINIYPAPFAIANVLSPKPDEWFAMLFISNIGEINNNYQLDASKLYEFLDRLLIERISFPRPGIELGVAVLSLFMRFGNTKALAKLVEFSKTKYIFESVQRALPLYTVKLNDNVYNFTLRKQPLTPMLIRADEHGMVKSKSIRHLI